MNENVVSLSRNPSLAEKLAVKDGVDFYAASAAVQDEYRKRAATLIAAAADKE